MLEVVQLKVVRRLVLSSLLALLMSPQASAAQKPTPVGEQFQVNTFTLQEQLASAVGPDGAGGFVIAWTSNDGYYHYQYASADIMAQRYALDGSPVGGEFRVNTESADPWIPLYHKWPDMASDGHTGFRVVWQSRGSDESGSPSSNRSIRGRRYAADGMPIGLEFQVNSYTTGDQTGARIGSDGGDGFVVTWSSEGSYWSDSSDRSIQGQRYVADGSPLGDEFQVNTYTTDNQWGATANPDGAGGFVIVWYSVGSYGTDDGGSIQGQRYATDGTRIGKQFQVNTSTGGNQSNPEVGPDGAGGFVVVWDSDDSNGSDSDGDSI